MELAQHTGVGQVHVLRDHLPLIHWGVGCVKPGRVHGVILHKQDAWTVPHPANGHNGVDRAGGSGRGTVLRARVAPV